MTAYPASRKYSALVAPRVPAEKLSMKRTVWFSSGTYMFMGVSIILARRGVLGVKILQTERTAESTKSFGHGNPVDI